LFKYIIYTYWIINEFNKIGKNILIKSPIYLKGGKYISIGNNFVAEFRLRIEAWDEYKGIKYSPQIIIGNNVIINPDCHIGAINEIIIGNNVLIASKVFITDHFHGEINSEAINEVASKRNLFSKGPVKIEDNVWIGEGVVILPNVIIGENSIIGANTVVTKDIPRNSIVGGIPAKILKTL